MALYRAASPSRGGAPSDRTATGAAGGACRTAAPTSHASSATNATRTTTARRRGTAAQRVAPASTSARLPQVAAVPVCSWQMTSGPSAAQVPWAASRAWPMRAALSALLLAFAAFLGWQYLMPAEFESSFLLD